MAVPWYVTASTHYAKLSTAKILALNFQRKHKNVKINNDSDTFIPLASHNKKEGNKIQG